MTPLKIHVNEMLIGILKSKTLSQFTAVELKKMFIHRVPDTKNKEAGQLVHRTLSKLCRAEFLKKQNDGKKVIFTKTLAFDESRLFPSKPRGQISPATIVSSQDSQLQKLKATLNQYQIDLLGHIGEAEEFKRLFHEYPETKATLYCRYMDARNQGSSMIGKIKAVEACVSTLEG